MKRSKQINLARMRKIPSLRLAPLSLAVAGTLFTTGCSDSREAANIYRSVDDCILDNPGIEEECRSAYREAVREAAKTAPKYRSLSDCEAEFGINMCQTVPGSNWIMPAMAGFLFARMMDNNRGYYYGHTPLFYSSRHTSPMYDRWTTADGRMYGSSSKRSVRVSRDAFKPKPAVTRTISRGGFGSTAAARSGWGSSSGRSSFGG